MTGIVIYPAFMPVPGALPIPVPSTGTTYYVITRNGVNQPGVYLDWNHANWVAQAYNGALDQLDQRAWGVTSVVA